MLVPLLALLIIVIAVITGASHGTDPKLPRYALSLDIGSSPYGRPVPPGFLGLSLETNVLPVFAGGNPATPNPTFLNLVRNLAPGQSPVIRIGGDTTDWTWITTPGFAKPGGIHYTIGRSWLRMAHAVAVKLNARMIPGINFEANSRAIVRHEAVTILRAVGRRYIAGFELGNEPELYGTFGWYRTPAGVSVPGRSIGYSFRSFLANFASISARLPRSIPLVGPASGDPDWLAGTAGSSPPTPA